MSLTPLVLTLQLIAVSVAVAAAIGIVGAWAAAVLHSAGRWGRIADKLVVISLVIALAMPLVLHATAWEATAGKFGWASMTQAGVRANQTGSYGFFSGLVAAGWIHGLFGAAIVCLATIYGSRRTPEAIVQQSRLDFGPVASWWKVRLPVATPWLTAALIAVALVAATEMTVVDLYGYRTIADSFYLYNAVDPSPLQVIWTCVVPWAFAAILLMWLLAWRQRLLTYNSGRSSSDADEPSSFIVMVCGLIATTIVCLIMLLPVIGLVIKAGHEVEVHDGVLHAGWSAAACLDHLSAAPFLFRAEYGWTLLIGMTTGFVSVGVAWPLAMLGRARSRAGTTIDLISVLAFAIPGSVVGMLVVKLFQQPLPGFRLLYGQTILPTVLALSVRAIPIAYWVIRSGYRGISNQVLETARLDLSILDRWRHVDRPLLGRTLLLALVSSSLYASGDVPATLPVIPAGVTTVGTRLFELLHSGARYQEASLAFWYLGSVVLFVTIVTLGRPDRPIET